MWEAFCVQVVNQRLVTTNKSDLSMEKLICYVLKNILQWKYFLSSFSSLDGVLRASCVDCTCRVPQIYYHSSILLGRICLVMKFCCGTPVPSPLLSSSQCAAHHLLLKSYFQIFGLEIMLILQSYYLYYSCT